MNTQSNPIRLVHITTVPLSLMYPTGFVRGEVGYMKARGFDVHAVSSPGKELDAFGAIEDIPVHAVEMSKRITPFYDTVALRRLVAELHRIRPSIVHAHTPKGGLLGMIAASLARVPVRIYHMHGLLFMTASGLKRQVLRTAERISCDLAHRVFCVSPSLREVALTEGLCSPEKIKVPGDIGSGVDADELFNPKRVGEETGYRVRVAHGIPRDALVVGFIGRIVRDKGLVELAEAWTVLRLEFPALHLLVIGPFESRDPVPPEVVRLLREDQRIHLAGYVHDIPPFYAAIDVLVLPSYREGFGSVAIEAAAMGLPVVATRIPGCVDAVADGMTGVLVPPRDARSLADAIRAYLKDTGLRRRHGQAGRNRVLSDFREETISKALYQEYVRLLRAKGIPVPALNGQYAY